MKKIIIALPAAIAAALTVCVYAVGGAAGAYAWSIAVFALAPLALAAALIFAVLTVVALCRKRKIGWKIASFALSCLFALPITVLLGISPVTYPQNADPADAITAVMPVKDSVLIGGKEHKAHAMWPSECYAYDILKQPYNTGSKNLEDYGIYGSEVFAPVSGTVVEMENAQEDIAPNTEEFTSSLGNYIFIRADETGTYVILAHFKQNSILVKAGEHIEQGTLIGQVGNSGTTSEPHLHIQHQRNNPMEVRFPTCAEGLPIAFEN